MNHNFVKLLKTLEVADMKGEKVMIDFQSGKYFLLKGVANDIWEHLSVQEKKIDDIVHSVAMEYELEDKDCRSDIMNFLDSLVAIGFVKYC